MSIWDSEPSEATAGKERAGGRLVFVVVLVLALLLAGGYAAASYVAVDKGPRGTSVAGVEIGGLEPEAAADELEEGLADRVDAPLEVSVADKEPVSVAPDELGLTVDHDASVAAAGAERSWEPQRLWDYFAGGDDQAAVVQVDEAAMERALEQLEADLGTEATDGRVRFTDRGVKTTKPETGFGIDPDTAVDALQAAFLAEERSVELELTDVEPEIDEGDVREAVQSFANPALSGPVTLVFEGSPVQLTPEQFGPTLSLVPENGELVPEVDAKRLTALVEDATGDKGAPVDATVRLVDGEPTVIPAEPGVTFDPDDITSTFLDLVVKPSGERRLEVPSKVDRPDFTTKEARELGIKEQVSEFTTYYPHAEYRNTNLGRAAEIIDGTLLKPGEVFSMNDIVGERTAENGFTEGFIISNGILKLDLGGGVSQMATTTFNAMFFAGLEDIEHKPHSFYISRYPVGREATVAWPTVDLSFRNDTEYGVLIESFINPSTPSTEGSVTVRMYSTKIWDIESTTSDRYAYTEPDTRRLDTPDCHPNTGYSGFSVDVTRIFRRVGESEVHHTEDFHTVYTPSDTVICE